LHLDAEFARSYAPRRTMLDDSRVSIEERRERIRLWIRWASVEKIVGGVSDSGEQCTICQEQIDRGQLDFIITLKGTGGRSRSLRLDRACMTLWREETSHQTPP
jgi:hypothetical protein